MPAKPSGPQQWGDPDAFPDDITEPSEPEKQQGFAAGNLWRQALNWAIRYAFIWIEWFDLVVWQFFHFGPDQALPEEGSAPVTGAGLSVSAASFSASVVAGGYMIGPISGPAHTYSNGSGSGADTYWDLGSDGVWDASVVTPTGAAAPALAANHVRVFMLRTNATDRASVVDYRRNHTLLTRPLDLRRARWGEDRLASASQAAEPRQTTRYRAAHGASYTHVHSFHDNASASGASVTQPASRLWLREATDELVLVKGCTWNGTQWVSDPGSPTLYTLVTLNGGNFNSVQLDAAEIGTPFNDSVWWDTQADGNGIDRTLSVPGRVSAGSNASDAYEASVVGAFRSDIPGVLTDRYLDLNAKAFNLFTIRDSSAGTSEGLTVGGRGGELVSNCVWNPGTVRWDRVYSATDSFKVDISELGLRIFRRDGAASDGWYDQIDPDDGWTLIADFGPGSTPSLGGVPTYQRSISGAAGLWDLTITNQFKRFIGANSGGSSVVDFGCLQKIADEEAGVIWPFDLPNGAIITGCRIVGTFDENTGHIRAAVYRLEAGAQSFPLRGGAPNYDRLSDGGDVARTLTIDVDAEDRTANNADRSFYVWVGCHESDLSDRWTIQRIEISYTMTKWG